MLLNTKVLVHFFCVHELRSPRHARHSRNARTFNVVHSKKIMTRATRPKTKMTHAKSIKSWPERTTILTLLLNFFFHTFFSFPIITHMWVYFYRNKKRSEICKWENRYAKHFPIYFGSSWMERKLGRFGSRDLKCRVNFHILLLFLELDSLPLGTLGNGSFAPHYSLFSKKAKVAQALLNWI